VTSFRFLHAADIHLDSPLHGLARYEGVPADEVRGATRAAFDNLIQHAIDEEVDFVVIAGDLFDGDWKDMGTGLYFSSAMGRLDKADIPVFLLAGNHDAASVLTRNLPWPPNVRQFGSRRPETHRIEKIGVAVHGQSFATAAVTENLVLAYPDPDESLFNIGVLHTALAGREGYVNYAPCDVNDLRAKRYDYWALGHVHDFEVVSTQPHVVFPGNIQGRSVREVGAKGAVIIDVVDREVISVEPVELDVIRWVIVDVDCTGANADEVQSLMRDVLVDAHAKSAAGRPMVARIILAGESRDAAALRDRDISLRDDARALAASVSPDLWIEKVKVRVIAPKLDAAVEISDDLSSLISDAVDSAELADDLREDLAPFISSAKASLGEANKDDEMRFSANAGDWARILDEAVVTLRSRLAGEI
jgi:DNA repair protein SbcD/Mre11